jgi:hypothetical protein
MRFSSLLFFSCAAIAIAQPASIQSPRLDFAWDSRTHQIRAIQGVPGAAILGQAAGPGYLSAAISPRHDVALVVFPDGSPRAIWLSSGEAIDLIGVSPSPSQFVFSPGGTAALAAGSRLQLLTGSMDAPVVQDVPLPPDAGTPASIAVSDDGQVILFSSGAGDQAASWQLAPGQSPVPLALPGAFAAAAFQPGSRNTVVVGHDGSAYRILNEGIPGEVRPIAAGDPRTAHPVALYVAADGAKAYSAGRSGTISSIDLASAAIDSLDCGCTPTTIAPAAASGIFRLNEISDRPVMLFDVSTATPRIWFVPADAPAADSRRSEQ